MRGQAAVETLMTIALVVMALVAMSIYVRRAYQDFLYVNASQHGLQFNPTQSYTDIRRLNSMAVKSDIEITTEVPTNRTPLEAPGVVCPGTRPCMPSLAGGSVPGQIITTTITTGSDWSTSRGATYDVR